VPRRSVGETAEPGPAEAHDVTEEVDEGGEDGAELDDGGVGRDRRVVHLESEEVLRDREVTGGGDGEVLGEALDDAEDDRIEVAQVCHGSLNLLGGQGQCPRRGVGDGHGESA
jgi:hypothetical protein